MYKTKLWSIFCIRHMYHYISFEYLTLRKSWHENSFIYSVSLSELSTSESSEGFGTLLEHPASEASGAPLLFTVCVNFNTDCVCVCFFTLEDFSLHRSKCAGRKTRKENIYHCLQSSKTRLLATSKCKNTIHIEVLLYNHEIKRIPIPALNFFRIPACFRSTSTCLSTPHTPHLTWYGHAIICPLCLTVVFVEETTTLLPSSLCSSANQIWIITKMP